jgi:ribosomal protein S1
MRSHPGDELQIIHRFKVKIIKLDLELKRIGLSMRQAK